jgi:type IV secretion system protein VirB8
VKHEQEYFEQAASWAADTQMSSVRSRRIAWIIGAVAIGIAALEAIALAMLVPLKTVQPITLLVDRHTGFVQALDPQSPMRVTADAALTESLLAQYVTAREGFDRAIVSTNYRKVALLSSGTARTRYLAEMPATNPSSPFQRYPAGTVVSVQVKSVSKLNTGVALVRFDTQQQSRGGPAAPPQPWVAVIRYQYTDAPMSLEDRLVNPLGFQVLGYRRDAEAPPVAVPVVIERPAKLAPAVGGPVQETESAEAAVTVPTYPAARISAPPAVESHIPSGSPLSNSGG